MSMAVIGLRNARHRSGFTLVELLVSMTIIAILAAVMVAVVPTLNQQAKAAQGADQLQGWLLVAKQMAKRDQRPRGIRLVSNTANNGWITQLMYIEQPDDYSVGQITMSGPNTATFDSGVDPSGGFLGTNASIVQYGDFLQVTGVDTKMYFITAITNGSPLWQVSVQNPNLPYSTTTNPPYSYKIIRGPRPLANSQPLELPQDVAVLPNGIPGSLNLPTPNLTPPANTNYYDILFSPSGGVSFGGAYYTGANQGTIVLWVTDTSNLTPGSTSITPSGADTLIAIYPRTGLIAAHPVNTNPSNYYSFTQDGNSSGM